MAYNDIKISEKIIYIKKQKTYRKFIEISRNKNFTI